MISMPPGMMPAAITRPDAIAGRLDGGKADEQRPRRGRAVRRMRTVTSVMTPEQALGTGQHAEQVVAAGIEVLAAEAHHLAVHEHDLEAQDVVGGDAVFQAVDAARVLGDVAADGAGDLARRVGRVVEAGVPDRLGDGEVGDARLDHGAAVSVIDVEDAVELRHAEHDAVGKRQRAPREPGAGAPRHHLDAALPARPEDARDLAGGAGQDDHHGKLTVGGEAVAFVGVQRVLVDDHRLGGQERAQRLGKVRAPGQRVAVGLGHLHGRIPSVHAPGEHP